MVNGGGAVDAGTVVVTESVSSTSATTASLPTASLSVSPSGMRPQQHGGVSDATGLQATVDRVDKYDVVIVGSYALTDS